MSYFDEILAQHYTSLPTGWTTIRAKFVIDLQTSNVDKVPVEGEEWVRLCNYTDVYYNDRITADLPLMEATATAKEIERFTLKAGQVLITKDSESWDDIGIPALVVEDIPGTLCGYHLAIYTPNAEFIDGTFLSWLCRANALNDQFKLSANGVTRFGLGQYALKNAVVGFPPLPKQKRIADFLNNKTTQIDALIDKKKQLLQRLAEKRQAIITQAVTKGINPAAHVKDSGIQWMSQIPAHWKVKRLRFLVRLISGATPTTGTSEYWNGDLNWISPKDMKREVITNTIDKVTDLAVDEYGLRRFTSTNVVIVVRGMILARTVPVALGVGQYTINQDMKALEANEKVAPAYLQMYLIAVRSFLMTLIAEAGHGTKALRTDVLVDTPVLVPPLLEQRQIVMAVDAQKSRLDAQADKVRNLIDRLTEYRSALITSAVTGQIKELC